MSSVEHCYGSPLLLQVYPVKNPADFGPRYLAYGTGTRGATQCPRISSARASQWRRVSKIDNFDPHDHPCRQRPRSHTTARRPVQKADIGHRQRRAYVVRQASKRPNHAACASCVHASDSIASSAQWPQRKSKVASTAHNCQKLPCSSDHVLSHTLPLPLPAAQRVGRPCSSSWPSRP